jgi:hypothetical protein
MDDLDREFKEHLVFVFNQVLQNLRKGGLSGAALEATGKMLFRLWQVFQAYKAKKKTYTLAEWLDKLISVGKDFQDAVAK